MDKAEIVFTIFTVSLLGYLAFNLYFYRQKKRNAFIKIGKLSPEKARLVVIFLNILFGSILLGGFVYLFLLPAKVSAISVKSGEVWSDYSKPYVIELDRPLYFNKYELSLSKEFKGEWRREKVNSLDIFSRRLAFYPEESLLPNDEFKVNLKTSTVFPVGYSSQNFEFSFTSTKNIPRLNVLEDINNKQNVDPRQLIEFTVEDSSRDSYILEYETSPQFEYNVENLEGFKTRLTPLKEYKNGLAYTIKILATPVSYNLQTKEIVKKAEKAELGTIEYQVAQTPVIKSIEPDGDLILTSEQITISFETEINKDSFEKSFKIEPAVAGTFQWNDDFTQVIYKPDAPLQKETEYTITLGKNLRSKYGARLEQDLTQFIAEEKDEFLPGFVQKFTTIGTVGITAVSPTPNSVNVAPGSNIVVTFNQDVDKTSAESKFSISPAAAGKISWSGNNVLTFDPNSNLASSQRYTVTIGAGIKSIEGLDLKTNYTFAFTIRADRFELSNFPAYYQNNYGYPFGCNITAAAMVVTYKGVNVNPVGFYSSPSLVDETTPLTLGADGKPSNWGDPNRGFVGSISGSPGTYQGYGVYWGPVSNTINAFLGAGRAQVYRGYNVTDMLKEVEKGNPAILWWQNGASTPTLLNWNSPTGPVSGVNGMHSEVVIGYIGSPENPISIITQDPWRGRRVIPISTFNSLWTYFGRTAVVVR